MVVATVVVVMGAGVVLPWQMAMWPMLASSACLHPENLSRHALLLALS